jgi:hypothetical protein
MSPSRSARYLAPLTKEERDTLAKVGFRHSRPYGPPPPSCSLRGRFVCRTLIPDPAEPAPLDTTYITTTYTTTHKH